MDRANQGRGVASIMKRVVRTIIYDQSCTIDAYLIRIYSAIPGSDDVPLQVGSSVASTRNLGYNAHRDAHAEKRGLVYETNGGYIRAVQTELSFSLVLVNVFY